MDARGPWLSSLILEILTKARRLANHLDARNEERKAVQQQIIDLASRVERSKRLVCRGDRG
jgi:single-stranded DNA-specific DHH superfamily exonuclease